MYAELLVACQKICCYFELAMKVDGDLILSLFHNLLPFLRREEEIFGMKENRVKNTVKIMKILAYLMIVKIFMV